MPVHPKPRAPHVLILYNESPDWPDSDKAWTARMAGHLADALHTQGYAHHAIKIYADLSTLDDYDPREWLIWNWVEELGGQPWTDAVAAAEFERRGFAFTGSSAQTLSLSEDRMNIKACLQRAGLPTLPASRFARPEQTQAWTDFPAIVKGATQHGSFGIEGGSVVHTREQLARRVAFMRVTFGCDSLVEHFLDTREFHVGILGNGLGRALPPVEYDYSAFGDMHDRLFTYQMKYDENSYGYQGLKLKCPSPADNPAWHDRLQAVAVAAYQALGVADYGRIDLRMLGDEPQVLDVNPNCDIDATSALMLGAKASGLSYAQVIGQIVAHAAERMPQ